jgi:hypothetical protein
MLKEPEEEAICCREARAGPSDTNRTESLGQEWREWSQEPSRQQELGETPRGLHGSMCEGRSLSTGVHAATASPLPGSAESFPFCGGRRSNIEPEVGD